MIKCFWQLLPKKAPPPNDNLSPVIRPSWHHHHSHHHARKILIKKWTCIVVSGIGAVGGLGVAAHHLASTPTLTHVTPNLFPSVIYANGSPLNGSTFAPSYNLPEPASSAAYLICGLFILVFLAFTPRIFAWCKDALR